MVDWTINVWAKKSHVMRVGDSNQKRGTRLEIEEDLWSSNFNDENLTV